jgi:hydrogenase expression/formation protein HypC
MCLGVPGRIVEQCADAQAALASGLVEFEGLRRRVCLELVPEAAVGDYVIVHAGIAISRIDVDEAERLLAHLRALQEDEWTETAP